MQAFVTQTQQLFSVIEEAIQKSERGAMGAGMGALPSNIQDRAVAIAKKNAESAFTLVEKIESPGDFDTSGPFCSRADAGLRH